MEHALTKELAVGSAVRGSAAHKTTLPLTPSTNPRAPGADQVARAGRIDPAAVADVDVGGDVEREAAGYR
jgi:hypothetical protein